jgi:hypothetical protein
MSFLAERPDVLEGWLQWSEDKRTSSGWYFSREDEGFIVGHLPDGPISRFPSMLEACAEFVLREAESIAKDLRSNTSLARTWGG